MVRAPIGIALIASALAGCALGQPAETPEQIAERHTLSCAEAGLTRDGEAWRLCLLIQQQNDRLAVIESRLRRVETQALSPPIFPYGWRY